MWKQVKRKHVVVKLMAKAVGDATEFLTQVTEAAGGAPLIVPPHVKLRPTWKLLHPHPTHTQVRFPDRQQTRREYLDLGGLLREFNMGRYSCLCSMQEVA